MAPSPEYDKEPKAPDKTTTIIPSEDTKVHHNSISDQLTNSDHKTSITSANSEVEVRRSHAFFERFVCCVY